jgi:hypothetical protein
MCTCHAHRRRKVAAGTAPFTRRRFVQALMVSTSLPAIAACDPGGVGEMFITGDQVEQMGVETWQRILAEEPRSDNESYHRRAQEMAARMLTAVDEDPDDWEVEVFAGDQVNAFALPGNKIGIYEGMFELAGDDDEVAAVIGHEIGHNQAEHARQRVAREIGTQAGIQLVSAALQVGNIGYANEVAGLLGAGAQFGVILPFYPRAGARGRRDRRRAHGPGRLRSPCRGPALGADGRAAAAARAALDPPRPGRPDRGDRGDARRRHAALSGELSHPPLNSGS